MSPYCFLIIQSCRTELNYMKYFNDNKGEFCDILFSNIIYEDPSEQQSKKILSWTGCVMECAVPAPPRTGTETSDYTVSTVSFQRDTVPKFRNHFQPHMQSGMTTN